MRTRADRCDWREKFGQCQFAPLNPRILHLESGQAFCPLHLPVDNPQYQPIEAYNLLKDAAALGITDFDGVTIPADKSFRPEAAADQVVTLRDCNLLGALTLNLTGIKGGASTLLGTPRTMGGRLVILPGVTPLHARQCTFSQLVQIIPQHRGDIEVDFSGAHFVKGLEIRTPMEGVWKFDRAKFDGVLTFQPERPGDDPSSKKANISFFRSRFSKSATPRHAEGLYRHWREWFAAIGDKDNEAFFFALEKRSQRRGLPLGLTRSFSAIYDFLSGYGQSFTRPLVWFGSVQVFAGLLYAWYSPAYELRPGWDGAIPAFTLSQLAKPFELLGVRANSELAVTVIGETVAPGWAIGTFLHGAVSLFLFTLFILALRWRFRRA